MNGIQPLIYDGIKEIGVFETLKPIITPLLSHNLSRISGFIVAGFAGTFFLDKLVSYSFDMKDLKLKISRTAIFIFNAVAGGYFARKFTLLSVSANVLKIQNVANSLWMFESMLLVVTAGAVISTKRNNSYITCKGAIAVLIAHLFTSSIYPTTRTLTTVNLFGSYAGLCTSFMLTKAS